MARMIIMREDGLNGQPNTPSGYRYVGYSGATFSEKSGASVSSIGSGGGGIIDITLAQLITDTANGDIVAGTMYHITDRGIYLQGLDTDKVSVTGHRIMKIVESSLYTPSTGVLGVWNNTLTPTIGDKVIWGGKVWENISGNVGNYVDDATLDSEWSLIPTTSTDYVDKVFGCKYDIVNDFVSKQWDERGNVFGIDLLTFSIFGFLYNPVDISDWGNNYIFMNDSWGIYNNSNTGPISNNSNVGEILNNSNADAIYYNSNTGTISNNSNVGGISNNSNEGGISSNSNADAIYYNSNTGTISNNSNTGEIYNNSNAGSIYSNSNAGSISNNSNTGPIYSNSNAGSIYSNSNVGNISSIDNTTDNIYYNSLNGDINTPIAGDITDPPTIVQVSPLDYGDTVSIGANRGQNFQVYTTGTGTGTASVDLLPAIPIGGTITVSDLGGNASTHNIDIDSGVGNTITNLGVSTQTITIATNGQSLTIRKLTATQYMLISKI